MTPQEECEQYREYNFFTQLLDFKESELYVSVKDNLCLKDVESTAGSKILQGYKPLFDATVIKRLKNTGASIIGKTTCDSFGFGTFNTNTNIIPKNPHDKNRVTGGSSGGSAGITAKANFNHISIGVSTGGSIACPASYCGVIGLTPTYGRISRHGLISYADSLDKIGILGKSVEQIKTVLEILSGQDNKDSTCINKPINTNNELKIGIIKESLEGISEEVKQAIQETAKKLGAQEISLPLNYKYAVATYYIIATCEASTNLARYSGLRYGIQGNPENKTNDKYATEIRSENLSAEEKRRIMLGTFARMAGQRDQYYEKALKVRAKLKKEYQKALTKYDVLISPTMPNTAPTFEETEKLTPLEKYNMDKLTVGPNLAGMPHVSIPLKTQTMPIGLLAIANHTFEGTLFKLMEQLI